jgi:hypothetical protein
VGSVSFSFLYLSNYYKKVVREVPKQMDLGVEKTKMMDSLTIVVKAKNENDVILSI